MGEPLLPLFPLNLVLLPATSVPLHIFEERYKELVGEALQSQSEFGIVLLMPQGLAHAGCTARITKLLRSHEDGRMDIMTEGHFRFEILAGDNSRSFLQARIRYFDDSPEQEPTSPALFEKVLRSYYALSNLNPNLAELRLNDTQISFQFGQASDDLGFRQRLLESRSEAERMQLLANHFAAILPVKQAAAQLKKAVPTNGHSKHPPVIQ